MAECGVFPPVNRTSCGPSLVASLWEVDIRYRAPAGCLAHRRILSKTGSGIQVAPTARQAQRSAAFRDVQQGLSSNERDSSRRTQSTASHYPVKLYTLLSRSSVDI